MVRFDTLCLSFTIAFLSVLEAWSQSPPSPPACVRACSDSSAQSASCSSTDVNCICNSDVFANDVASCVLSSCSSADAAAAVGYFEALCSGATTSSLSLTVSGIPSTGSSSTTASGSQSATLTGSSSVSASGSSSSSPSSSLTQSPSSVSGLSSSASSTASGTTSHTSSISGSSSVSASSTTPTTTPPPNHAVHGYAPVSFTGAGFALVLAVVFVAW